MSAWGRVVIDPPDWIDDVASPGASFGPTDRMPFVIELARRNVVEQTGGPFGAAIFESATGILVAPGVNRVVPTAISLEWRRDGEVLKTSRDIVITAHDSGFRVWDALQSGLDIVRPGHYQVTVRTSDRRIFGRAEVTVNPSG